MENSIDENKYYSYRSILQKKFWNYEPILDGDIVTDIHKATKSKVTLFNFDINNYKISLTVPEDKYMDRIKTAVLEIIRSFILNNIKNVEFDEGFDIKDFENFVSTSDGIVDIYVLGNTITFNL